MTQLQILLADAANAVEVGAHYAHYKHPDVLYTVTGLSILEATDAVAVKYAMVSNPGVEFVRPLQSWLDTVEWHGQDMPRFAKV